MVACLNARVSRYLGAVLQHLFETIERQGMPPLLHADWRKTTAGLNYQVVPWCRAQGPTVTRSRAYKKNNEA